MKQPSVSWVFYQRLRRDALKPKKRPELMELLNEGGKIVADARSNVQTEVENRDGQILIQMAQAELYKEQAMLNQIFHANINVDLRQPGAIKDLIDTLNACLNLKSVYERNKQLITSSSGGQKGVFSFFSGYILKAFDKYRPAILKEIIGQFENGAMFFDSVKSVLDKYFSNNIIPEAIELMLDKAEVENGVETKYQKAYAEVISAIHAFPNGPISTGLKAAWGLNDLINNMAASIMGNTTKEDLTRAFNKYSYEPKMSKSGKMTTRRRNTELRSLIKGCMGYQNEASGLSLEALRDQISSMVVNGIPNFHLSNGTFEMDGSVSGDTIKQLGYKKMRPDGAVIMGIDGTPIESWINATPGNADRNTAIDLFNRIGHYVENIDNGFIVYTNSKNYTLNDNFARRGGYSAGTAMSLRNLESVLGKFLSDVDSVVKMLLNAGKGAISQGNTDNVSKILAEAIAYALFDDWDFIGQANKDMGGNSLHIMDLNGVLIPLSVFLFSLGEAISSVEQNPSSFARAHVTPASYDTSNESSYYIEQWEAAIQYGLDNTKISFHFMKDIRSFLNF